MSKKSIKKSLLLLALSAIMLFAMSITATAATNATITGLKQVTGYETSVRVSWNAAPSADLKGYYVYFSTDGVNFARLSTSQYPDAYSAEAGISGLTAGSKYYVKVAACYDAGNYTYVAGPLSNAISVVTAPKSVDYKTIIQTNATTSNISCKWTGSYGASGYVVTLGTTTTTVTATSATLKQAAGNYNYCKVQAFKQSNEGFRAYAGNSTSVAMYSAPKKPIKVASAKYGTLKWQPTESNKVKIGWDMPTGYTSTTDGFQIQIYSIDGKKKLKTYNIANKYTYYKEFNIRSVKNKGFKVRIRAYKLVSGKKCYGSWSSFKAVVPQAAVKIQDRVSYTSFKAVWPKIKNVKKYYVYVCKNENVAQKDQVWKKVATLGSNATSYVAKNLKVGKYNAIYVIPVVKVGGKTYKAEATWYKYTYMSSYY